MKQILLTTIFLLTACNREEQPAAPTAEQADRLNDAETMLNSLANEEGAAPEDTAPPLNQH
ncbi:hypothetical protein [Sphingomonas sp.]|uniref:hypothetical protein n=1 Tax=Sphingomonas sp. TaxID=28214 RepID=UPI0025E0A793|nr:hypothetical protein [Sphingomonas sp.]